VLPAVRGVVLANLPAGLEPARRYQGMTTWVIPAPRSPRTHDGRPLPVLALGERKAYVSLSIMAFYFVPGFRDRFDARWRASGCPLDRGQATVRMRELDDVPLEVIADTVAECTVDRVVAAYEQVMAGSLRRFRPVT